MFKKIYDAVGGRTTMFLVFFAIVGTGFRWVNKLDATFISFFCAHMGFVLGHSYKEDVAATNGVLNAVGGVQQPPAPPAQ